MKKKLLWEWLSKGRLLIFNWPTIADKIYETVRKLWYLFFRNVDH